MNVEEYLPMYYWDLEKEFLLIKNQNLRHLENQRKIYF